MFHWGDLARPKVLAFLFSPAFLAFAIVLEPMAHQWLTPQVQFQFAIDAVHVFVVPFPGLRPFVRSDDPPDHLPLVRIAPNPLTLRKYRKHSPNPQRLWAVVNLISQSAITAFSSLSFGV